MLKSLFVFFALLLPSVASALKIDDTHYRFCVMDDATIKDSEAVQDKNNGRLRSNGAYWTGFNMKASGATYPVPNQFWLDCSGYITELNILMEQPIQPINSANGWSLRHSWEINGSNGHVNYKGTSFYITIDAPTGVSLTNTPSTMLIGDEKSIGASLEGSYTSFSGNGYFDYSYSSSNSDVLAVSSSGKLTAKKDGKATITVKAYAKNRSYSGSYYIGSASKVIEVVNNLTAKAISIEPQSLDLTLGQEASITATITPKEAETEITWTSSNNDVASVENGRVKAIGKGKANITAKTSNGLTAACAVTVSVAPAMSISDVNCSWGTSREQVISSQEGGYYICQENEAIVVFTKMSENMDEIYLAYKFDKEGKLCASTLSMPENNESKHISDELLARYDSEISFENGLEVKTDDSNLIAVDISSTINGGGNIITIGFSYYEPLEERDDCVDLGLSVRWATMNLGASKPSGIGGFYAFSETSTKSEYWRENYAYCNNNSNQYIFDYTNPKTNICGTKYDVATKQLGEGWKMPSLAEANELISKCTWEKEIVDGVDVFKVTGPNGNHIILPVVSWKMQRQEYNTWQLHLGIGECSSKSSEYTYVITFDSNGQNYIGSIGEEWKAWGYNIRPVYTK